MVSAKRRNSTRAGEARSARSVPPEPGQPAGPCREPPASKQPGCAEVLCQLNEVRSIFVCAGRCLDEMSDPHRLDASDKCEPMDVAVVVRAGIAMLRKAQQFLDTGNEEGAA